ncbi:putative adenosine deaminase CECR1-like [Apostichopus japonicus]|uniref:Putative adenosine deaminase CECR1-like n=1 Tax=Stichopus japonicus TaxID=307972 RepID=A0A2G8L418_STIJA|nr:putative adenosine deaminase CECR1-like [Apostichopus japonicus]
MVLSFVNDLSNHPGVTLFSRNLPVVICSDDPGSWRTSGLSYDYYAAFLYFTRADDGLRALKEISRNGIKYSAMKENEKRTAMEVWQQNWDQFIKSNLQGYESTPESIQHTEL